jgi:hypothetical protein
MMIEGRALLDHLRCDAVAVSTDQRCGSHFSGFRDGQLVCWQHLDTPRIEYTCGNRFDAFGKVMARALGDAVPDYEPDALAGPS